MRSADGEMSQHDAVLGLESPAIISYSLRQLVFDGSDRLKDFSYAAPTSLKEATQLLAQANGKAKLLAGGTDILVQLREGLRDADLVVDVKKIPELMEIYYSPANGLRLGASEEGARTSPASIADSASESSFAVLPK